MFILDAIQGKEVMGGVRSIGEDYRSLGEGDKEGRR